MSRYRVSCETRYRLCEPIDTIGLRRALQSVDKPHMVLSFTLIFILTRQSCHCHTRTRGLMVLVLNFVPAALHKLVNRVKHPRHQKMS
ncbi:hypothetical protein J6590_089669 [Homalodisca vitripennis]|nr:hypothetical protein J6590_089669 [Homalodisca vitripennis]